MDALGISAGKRAWPVGFALLLAVIEFFGVASRSPHSPGDIGDGVASACLVYGLFGTAFIFSGLIPSRGSARLLCLAAFHLVVAVLAAVLFTSWIVRWVLGQPLSGDATRVLMESPAASILHLGESDGLLFAVSCAGTLIFVYSCARVVNFAAHAWKGANVTPRALTAGVYALLAGLSWWQVANAGLTWSSYGSLVWRDEAQPTMDYTCPGSPDVPITSTSVRPVRRTPIIVIVLESWRSDLLRAYPGAMPFLSELARESVVFDHAYAAATHSDLADISIWYSRHALYADRRLGYPVDAPWRGTSAFEYAKGFGYRTAYFSSQDERWGGMINWMKLPSLDAFFDAHNLDDPQGMSVEDVARFMQRLDSERTESGKVPDNRTLELAGNWVERHADEPFLMGLNLQNSHFAYQIPPGGEEPFQPADRSLRDIYFLWPEERASLVRNRYLNAIYNMDAMLARFAKRLRETGVWDRSIVLFVGDHGEAFYEHAYGTHSGPPFDEMARAFAMVKLPKGDQRNGTVFAAPVSSVDFVPMVVQLAGMPAWPGFQGRSPYAAGDPSTIFMTVNSRTRENAILRWPWKLMDRTFPERAVELYHLGNDPGETRNVAGENPEQAARLAAELDAWRLCQVSYYADRKAHTRLNPPRY